MPTTLLFCDAEGTVLDVHDETRRWSRAVGSSLIHVLGLSDRDAPDLLPRLCTGPSLTLPSADGERLSVRLATLPPALSPAGGFVACLTLTSDLGILENCDGPLPAAPTAASLDYAVFNAVFNDVRDAIILTDENLRILTANPTAHRLYAPEDGATLTGQDFLSLFDAQDRDGVRAATRKLKSGASWKSSLAMLRHGTSLAPAKFKVRCLSAGGVRLYQFMLRDQRDRMALERDLEMSRQAVAGMNIALKQVLLSAEEEKQELKDDLVQQMREEVLPVVDRLAREDSPLVREAFKTALEEKIADLTDPPLDPTPLSSVLTPREADICRLIQQGWQGRAMAEELGISFETLQTHRKNIRRKLGLRGAGASLQAFLQQSQI